MRHPRSIRALLSRSPRLCLDGARGEAGEGMHALYPVRCELCFALWWRRSGAKNRIHRMLHKRDRERARETEGAVGRCGLLTAGVCGGGRDTWLEPVRGQENQGLSGLWKPRFTGQRGLHGRKGEERGAKCSGRRTGPILVQACSRARGSAEQSAEQSREQ